MQENYSNSKKFIKRRERDLDLDPDSAHVRVDALGQSPMVLLYVEGRCLYLFPGKSRSW